MHEHDSRLLDELKLFATFSTSEQRYIRRSLEVAADCGEAAGHWARGVDEAAAIGRQANVYKAIAQIRALIPTGIEVEDSAPLIGALVALSAFDLEQGKLGSFAAYRFLYERLIGAAVRPWLVAAYCAAAALPCIHPELRAELFASLCCDDVAAKGWSNREPEFFPEWVEKVGAC